MACLVELDTPYTLRAAGYSCSREIHNPANQLNELTALGRPEHRQIGVRRMQTGQRVDLHKLWPARFVTAEIDAACVAPADGLPSRHGDRFRFGDALVAIRIAEDAIDELLGVFFIR